MEIKSIEKRIYTSIHREKIRKSSLCFLNIKTENNNYVLEITDKQRKLLVKNLNLLIWYISDSLIVYGKN